MFGLGCHIVQSRILATYMQLIITCNLHTCNLHECLSWQQVCLVYAVTLTAAAEALDQWAAAEVHDYGSCQQHPQALQSPHSPHAQLVHKPAHCKGSSGRHSTPHPAAPAALTSGACILPRFSHTACSTACRVVISCRFLLHGVAATTACSTAGRFFFSAARTVLPALLAAASPVLGALCFTVSPQQHSACSSGSNTL